MASATAPKTLSFDVVMLSYYERPIFDVQLNGIEIGAGANPPQRGNGGLMTGVPIQLGAQKITWRLDGPKGMPGNGDTVTAANIPDFKDPGPDYSYLGVHVYPDNTVELVPEKFWPERTAKGEAFTQAWERKHGQ